MGLNALDVAVIVVYLAWLKNEKLLERGTSIVQCIAKVNRTVTLSALEVADMQVPVALVMLCGKVTKAEAVRRLKRAHGSIRRAIKRDRCAY